MAYILLLLSEFLHGIFVSRISVLETVDKEDVKPSFFEKIVFLDIDGVLNHTPELRADKWSHWADDNLDEFQGLIQATDAQIVLSSSWRTSESLYKRVRSMLDSRGVGDKLIDKTVDGGDVARAVEIRDWLARHRVRRFAIIDDDDDAGFGFPNDFFQTDARYGLTNDIASAVIEHLNRND